MPQVKRNLVRDPRYDAVGSSTLREELFGTFLKALSSDTSPNSGTSEQNPSKEDAEPKDDRKSRAERALREREGQMRAERGKVEREIELSKAALGSSEAELDLMNFYIDSVRDPLVCTFVQCESHYSRSPFTQSSYYELEPTFSKHQRFASSPLPSAQKQRLFVQHTIHIAAKYRTALEALFLHHAPLLSATFTSLPEASVKSLESSLPATKLGLRSNDGSMHRAFDQWMTHRTGTARQDFQKLLEENSFVEFWGKVGKIEGRAADGGIVPGEDDDLTDEGEQGGGKADLKTLARVITEKEVERVLKVCFYVYGKCCPGYSDLS